MATCRSVVGLALVGLALLGCKQSPDEIVKNLRSEIQQALPIGSNKDQVIAFLSSHGLGETSYSERTKTLYKMIRNVSRSFFGIFKTDIQLQFFFDDQDKLTGYTVEKVVTSF